MVLSSGILDHSLHVVYIPNPQGNTIYKQYGYTKHSKEPSNGHEDIEDTLHGLYILPEEALYLLEKGLLDITNDTLVNSMELLFSWINGPKSFYKVYKYLKDLDYIVFSLKHPFSTKLLQFLSVKDYNIILWFDFIAYQPNTRFKKSKPSELPFCFIHLVPDCNQQFIDSTSQFSQILNSHFPTSRHIEAITIDEEIIFLSQNHHDSLFHQ